MPYNNFFEHPSFFKQYFVNNAKTKMKWKEMLHFNHQIQYIGLDKGYMMKLVYINDEGNTHDVFLRSTCLCCKGDNPEVIYPVMIGKCKQTCENLLRMKIFAMLKKNYMIIDDNMNIIQKS